MANTDFEKQEHVTENVETQEARTFTQEEVNAMMQTRLSKERAKFADYEELKAKADKYNEIEEANKTELQKATERADALQARLDEMENASKLHNLRTEVSKETGVPVDLLTADTTEGCKQQAEAILAFAKPSSYPSVHDAGEATGVNTKTTGDQFADWLNQNLKR